jgi:hypothetical protein
LSKVVGLRKFTYMKTICVQTGGSCLFAILEAKKFSNYFDCTLVNPGF